MIGASENYNSILIRYCFCWNTSIVLVFAFVLEMLVHSSCVFSALVVSIHHLWFRFILIYGPEPGKIFIFDSLSQWASTRKKGADLMLSSSLPQSSTSIVIRLSLSLIRAIAFTLMSSPIAPSHSTHAPSHSRDRFLFARLHKKQWNIFTHEKRRKEKSRIVAYKNEIEGEEKSGQ